MPRQTEYPSIFSPFDAEAAQGKDRMNPQTTEGLHRINSFINNHLSKGVLNPHQNIAELKTKLNHLNLDFDFDNNMPIQQSNTFMVNHADVFGVTPQTDLSKGFDNGSDLPKYRLTINSVQKPIGFSLSGNLEPENQQVAEAVEEKIKSQKRIENVKKMLKKKK
jgi:hypothetical protein